jgi:ATP-dependent protease Clp ATPase subunit
MAREDLLKCSECRKNENQVRKLVQLRGGFLLCNECVSGCASIMNDYGLLDLDVFNDVGNLTMTEVNIELDRRIGYLEQLQRRKAELMRQTLPVNIAKDFLSAFR